MVRLEFGMGPTEGGFMTWTLSGKVNETNPTGRTWVRLSGVYADLIMDSPVASDGGFSFKGVPQGQYVLITIRSKRVLDTRVVPVPSKEIVQIQLKE